MEMRRAGSKSPKADGESKKTIIHSIKSQAKGRIVCPSFCNCSLEFCLILGRHKRPSQPSRKRSVSSFADTCTENISSRTGLSILDEFHLRSFIK